MTHAVVAAFKAASEIAFAALRVAFDAAFYSAQFLCELVRSLVEPFL